MEKLKLTNVTAAPGSGRIESPRVENVATVIDVMTPRISIANLVRAVSGQV